MQFLDALFSSGPFMPHGYCYMWVPGLVWLHVISDSLIALAYLSIPFTLAYFVRRRTDLPFNWMFLCFGVFILACGATHAMEVWNLWHADYWVAGVSQGHHGDCFPRHRGIACETGSARGRAAESRGAADRNRGTHPCGRGAEAGQIGVGIAGRGAHRGAEEGQ